MLELPNVTLVIAETRAYALCERAVNDICAKVQFGDIVYYSDRELDMPGSFREVKDWGDKIASGHFYYTQAANCVQTSHALLMEWDAGVYDVQKWTADFLQYDLIGAPWYGMGHVHVKGKWTVGNGGFMLLSRKLIDFLYRTRDQLKIATDYHLCCWHRELIERESGCRWAPFQVADKFSYEGWDDKIPEPELFNGAFGYHGVFNWRSVLDKAELIERTKLLYANEFTRKSKYHVLLKSAPWLAEEAGLPSLGSVRRGPTAIDRIRERQGRAIAARRMLINRHTNSGLKA